MNSDATPFLLTELIGPGGINLRLTSGKRDGILEELVGMIPEIKDNAEARTTLLRALKEREQLYSTSIGDGVAIPHARNALVGLVQRAVIIFGRHPEGIIYGPTDHESTRIFFLIIAPTVTQHLAILARLSRMLRNPLLRKNLLAAEKADRVLALLRESEASFQMPPRPS